MKRAKKPPPTPVEREIAARQKRIARIQEEIARIEKQAIAPLRAKLERDQAILDALQKAGK